VKRRLPNENAITVPEAHMNVLIALDAGDSSDAILKCMLARPWPRDTKIRLFHIVDTQTWLTRSAGLAALVDEQCDRARTRLAKLVDSASVAGAALDFVIALGDPRTQIVEHAKEWNADWIVVGAARHSLLSRMILGGVSRAVLRESPCSVEIVRFPERDAPHPFRILLATDGSECSRAATRVVAERTWPAGTEVKIVHALELPLPLADPWFAYPELAERVQNDVRAEAERIVAEAEVMLAEGPLTVSRLIETGATKHVILDEANAWQAELIVLGTHGRRGAARFFVGSVCEAVAVHSERSVAVIRAPLQTAE
jgi:nucleotide-binding universal stress UspA family protein